MSAHEDRMRAWTCAGEFDKKWRLQCAMQGDKANQMNTMQRLAAKAITRKILAGGDFLFVQYDQQSHMGVLLSGKLIYAKVDSRNFESEEASAKKDRAMPNCDCTS
eukprot:3100193-Amphidinium_carterae.1